MRYSFQKYFLNATRVPGVVLSYLHTHFIRAHIFHLCPDSPLLPRINFPS